MGAALISSLAAPAAFAAPNGAPVPGRDLIETTEDHAAVTGNVLGNDTDPDGDTLSVSSYHAPGGSVGTLTIASNGDYSFTPAANYADSDIAWYFVTDGHGATGIVYIDIVVHPVNDPPVAADYTFGGTEDTQKTLTNSQLTAGVTDIDGGVPSVTGVSGATGGTVGWASNTATFTPTADLCGNAAAGFDYTVDDGNGGTDTGHVTLNLACTNDGPTAVDDEVSTDEEVTLTFPADDLAANDEDIDGDTLSVTHATDGGNGSVQIVAGDLSYTPDTDFFGEDTFTYTVSDGNGGTDTGTVTVTVANVNDAPVAVDDTGEIAAYDAGEDFDVAANDEDIDGDTLAASAADVDPAQGVATIVNGQVHFVPTDGFTGEAVITYTVSDGDLTDEGTLTLDVLPDTTDPVPAAPTVTFGSGRVNETAPLLISWSATDVAGSGVASYDVQVSVAGGPFTPVYTGAATHVTKFYPFGASLVWRVRATDEAANTSDWVTSGTRTIAAYQGGSPVTRTGTWTKVGATSASGTSYRYTTEKGNKVSLTVTGREILFVGTKGTRAGSVKVYLDGVRIGTYSEYATKTLYGRILARATWGATASHRMTIIAAQDTKRTTFDAFIVLK